MSERAGINWVQVSAAALAAVSSAVVLSTLGVAGTLIGAALGSVTASLGSNIYSRGINLSKQQVAAQAAALRRVSAARENLEDATAQAHAGDPAAQRRLDSAGEELHEAERVLHEGAGEEADAALHGSEDVTPDDARTGMDLRRLPWKRIAVLSVSVFVLVMGVITAFEVVTGRAVSAYTGGSDSNTGSTVGGTVKDLGGKKNKNEPSESPSPGASATETPSSSPTDQPSTATSEPTPTETTPSDTVTESPTPTEISPTETPVVTPTPGVTVGATPGTPTTG